MPDTGSANYYRVGPDGAVTLTADPPLEDWHLVGAPGQPAFQHGWANADPTYSPQASFRMDHDGRVWLRGLITAGTVANNFTAARGSAAAWTLPAAYTPRKTRYLTAVTYDAAGGGLGNDAWLRLVGKVDGAANGSPGALDVLFARAAWIDLGEISFDPND